LIETEVEQPVKECSTALRIEFNALDIAFIVEILFFLAVAVSPDVAAWIANRLASNPEPSTRAHVVSLVQSAHSEGAVH
jgi:hypothetical protein